MAGTSSENEPALLFHWKAPKTFFSIRLLAASVAAIVIHGFCFYIFQVEEPTARRTLPQTHEIVMLSLDARSAALLRQVEELEPRLSTDEKNAVLSRLVEELEAKLSDQEKTVAHLREVGELEPTVSVNENTPVLQRIVQELEPTLSVIEKTAALLRQVDDYYAGFEGTLNPQSPLQISLDALPETRPNAAPAPAIRPLYDALEPVAPETPEDGDARMAVLPENQPYVPPPERHLPGPSFVLSPGLERRGWQNGAPQVVFGDPAAVAPASGQIAWRVAVAPSGRVEFVFPLRVRESPELDEVASRLRRSRFQAMPEAETELHWGTIALQW